MFKMKMGCKQTLYKNAWIQVNDVDGETAPSELKLKN
jgi:hypothetical protein